MTLPSPSLESREASETDEEMMDAPSSTVAHHTAALTHDVRVGSERSVKVSQPNKKRRRDLVDKEDEEAEFDHKRKKRGSLRT